MTTTTRAGDEEARKRVWAFVAVLVTSATAGSVLLYDRFEQDDFTWATLVLAVSFAAIERWVFSVRLSDRTQSLTLSEIPLVIGLFTVSPAALVVARLVGIIPSLVLSRRQPPVKVAYNVAYQWVETLLAIGLVSLLAPSGFADPGRATAAAMVVAVVTNVMGAAGIATAMSLHRGRWHGGLTREIVLQSAGPHLATTAFAVSVLAAIRVSPWLMWTPAAVALVLWLVFRSHIQLIHLHDRQAQTLALVRRVTGTHDVVAVAEALVEGLIGLGGVSAAGIGRVDAPTSVTWVAATEDPRHLTAAVALGDGDDPADAHRTVIDGHEIRSWVLDEQRQHVLVVAIEAHAPSPADLLVAIDQIANHAAVALDNAFHAQALEHQARDAAERALIDPLTGLPNRSALTEGLDAALAAGEPFSTLLIDLDDFKEINDALGHAAGDEVLLQVTRRLHPLAAEALMIARLGGDEFAILVRGGESAAREFAQLVLERIQHPVEVPPYALQIGGSVGVAVYPAHGTDAVSLLKHADLAMYEAKRSDVDVAVFGSAAAGMAVRHLEISTAWRTAIEAGQVTAMYQPQIDLRTGRVIGVEALARWTHPDLGMIMPDEFIKVAEQSGQLPLLTELMVDDALSWHRRWADQGLDLQVSVNLSPRSLVDSELPPRLALALDRHGVSPDRLTIEITENSVISDPHRVLRVLGRLSRLGVRLSIDDFGTGYSSLAYLQELPVDEVKIDKSFVMPMSQEGRATPLVGGIIRLCRELGLSVVAEGIESAAVGSVLRQMGCDAGQGFHYARALPPEDILMRARVHDVGDTDVPDRAAEPTTIHLAID